MSVDVILTTYNSEPDWLRDSVESFVKQTIKQKRLIVVDDGSEAHHRKEVTKITAIPGITLIMQNNQGLSAARNKGVTEGFGEFVGFLDHDDTWHPQFLEKLVAYLDCFPTVDAVFSCVERVDVDLQRAGKPLNPKLNGLEIQDFLIADPTCCGSSMVIRRSVFDKLGGFNPKMRGAEIPEFFIRFLAEGYSITGIPEVLVNYRNSPGSLSKNTLSLLRFRLICWFLVLKIEPFTALNPFNIVGLLLNQARIFHHSIVRR